VESLPLCSIATGSFAAGLVSGLVAAIVFELARSGYKRLRIRRALSGREGMYRIRPKLSKEPWPNPLSIRVRGKVLVVTSEADSYHGEIVMNDELITSGRGHYSQSFEGDQLWGFWDVQLGDARTILVHRHYADYKTREEVVSGLVWELID
jgi:hypothetical protein